MFDSVRKHQRILLFVVILLIFPAFAFFGIQGYDRFFSAGTDVATVNGEPITRPEFDQAHREQLDRMRQMLGGAVDTQLFDTPQLRSQVLENLIVQRVMAIQARESRIAVSDERLREAIRALPGLVGPDGKFNVELYRNFVSARGRSEAGFEAELRRDLAMQAVPDSLFESAWMPAAVLDRLLAIIGERREVSELRFDPAKLAGDIRPDDAQLKAFFDKRSSQYQVPESVDVQYVVLDAEALVARSEVRDGDIQSFYEQNKARYSTTEERSAAHILIKLDPKASAADREAAQARVAALRERLGRGEDFAALARAESEDPGSAPQGGDLGYFTRELMVKPFADAAFSMKEGEVTGPVETEFGLHIIRLTGVRPAQIRPLESVRAEIETELKREIASRKLAESADTFTNTVYEQPDSLDPVVEKLGLSLATQAGVTRGGAPALGREHPLNHPKVLSSLFSDEAIRERRNIEAVDQGGRIISARVTAHQPPRQRSFDEVREEVLTAVVREQALQRAREQGQALLKTLTPGASASGAGESKAPAFADAVEISRVDPGSIPQPALEAIFKSDASTLPQFVGVDLGDAGYGVYRISKRALPNAEQLKTLREASAPAIERAAAEQDLRDYLEARKAEAEITRSLARIAAQTR
jgi:peptidyl-prolyl cis-trans isomerase D